MLLNLGIAVLSLVYSLFYFKKKYESLMKCGVI